MTDVLYAIRKSDEAKAATPAVYVKHGSRMKIADFKPRTKKSRRDARNGGVHAGHSLRLNAFSRFSRRVSFSHVAVDEFPSVGKVQDADRGSDLLTARIRKTVQPCREKRKNLIFR